MKLILLTLLACMLITRLRRARGIIQFIPPFISEKQNHSCCLDAAISKYPAGGEHFILHRPFSPLYLYLGHLGHSTTRQVSRTCLVLCAPLTKLKTPIYFSPLN